MVVNSGIVQLPPIAAEARLMELGYRLSWRREDATGPNTGYAEASSRAPATGWISDAVGSSGELIVTVQDPARPSAPSAAPPTDCPTPAP